MSPELWHLNHYFVSSSYSLLSLFLNEKSLRSFSRVHIRSSCNSGSLLFLSSFIFIRLDGLFAFQINISFVSVLELISGIDFFFSISTSFLDIFYLTISGSFMHPLHDIMFGQEA